ncbi:hypothetical protein TNIN_76401 [Trichonephila inaurata madagascariensis]|uniref:Uncharacterized protein n=1 Tax=Trichonephila inaurata madagascariensis TaxID=2747483 RepID=A0A8X6X118_9ARAC|nr:hypothetical protein TNIN_76401 [Trichonephila inaurata madagascariensis]
MSHDLPAADLLSKKAIDLEDLSEIESISLSTIRQLEPVNNPTSTVKTSAVLLASEEEAAVSESAAYLKVGSLVRWVRFFILNIDLPYALLGLGSCIAFQLIIDCVKQVVVQKGRNLINFSSSEGSDLSLHINPENKVKEGIFESEMKNDKTKECSIVKGKKGNCSQVKKKEKVNKDEIDVVKNRTRENDVLKFSNISETDSDNGCTRCQIEVEDNSETKDSGENFELKEILECYEDVFAKDKYDVGTIRIEPQRTLEKVMIVIL